ncbi:hypothetical protein [Ktedonospora formicarum]|uniref:Uncharacterized protein n=1 Tax=Ktedonospora formicarum TaxID=2778364 RepID=A0A8J3IGK7_9CHLR|nr:hypothetical protein [Ktedonospora formicarum]GHO50784.1 hypothetical protein KSX_89470 [Ktedonospora formicarum]
MIRPCPECGGQRVRVAVGTPTDRALGNAPLELKQEERKVPFLTAIKGDKINYSGTTALTCTQCGYTALYATHPHKLIPDA